MQHFFRKFDKFYITAADDTSAERGKPGGVLKYGFGRDAAEFESRPIQIPILQGKSDLFIYQSDQFWAKFLTKSPQFSKIFLNLSQFWLKFGENFDKSNPFIYHIFAFYKGSLIYQEADFATHVGSTSPLGLLYLGVTTGCILPIGYSVLLPWIQTSLSWKPEIVFN